MYNAQGTCYGGPDGGQINIVNNYYKAGPSKSLSSTTLNGIKVSVSNGKERSNQELDGEYYSPDVSSPLPPKESTSEK